MRAGLAEHDEKRDPHSSQQIERRVRIGRGLELLELSHALFDDRPESGLTR